MPHYVGALSLFSHCNNNAISYAIRISCTARLTCQRVFHPPMLCSPGDKKMYVPLFPLPQELDRMAEGEGEEGKMAQMSVIKPLHKIVSEHKDVNKIVIQLNSIISTFKGEVEDVLKDFNKYSDLWSVVSDFDLSCLIDLHSQGQSTHILIRSNTHLVPLI